MITFRTVIRILGTLPFLLTGLMAQTWTLPQNLAVKDSGTRTYRFVVDYNTGNTRGEIVRRQRITGEYTRGLPEKEVVWHNVTSAIADGSSTPYGTPEKQAYMEGFKYPNDLGATMKPDFFKVFPPAAVMERNLVWDTGMFELFGHDQFAHLKLNEPYHYISNAATDMPDVGTFTNRDVVLVWTGNSQMHGQDCALIEYRAFFNPLDIKNSGVLLKGRSNYWGLIWVSLSTKQIEYATLYEEVLGELTLPGQNMQVMDVFRVGTFEPVEAR